MLFAFCWLGTERDRGPVASDVLRHWWRALQPFAVEVVDEGEAREIGTLFHQFHEPDFIKIIQPEELLDLVARLCVRIAQFPEEADANEKRDWQSTVDYAADELHRFFHGASMTSAEKDAAYRTIRRLAEGKVPSAKAARYLQEIRNALV